MDSVMELGTSVLVLYQLYSAQSWCVTGVPASPLAGENIPVRATSAVAGELLESLSSWVW